MIEPLADLPAGVIGFEAIGEVQAADYTDALLPAIEQAASSGKIRLVYVLGDRFEGYSAGATWQDVKLGFEHLRAWERIAVVTDKEWMAHLVGAFGWMVPGELKHFALDQRAEAIAWAAASE